MLVNENRVAIKDSEGLRSVAPGKRLSAGMTISWIFITVY
jgi:hypothetical protein